MNDDLENWEHHALAEFDAAAEALWRLGWSRHRLMTRLFDVVDRVALDDVNVRRIIETKREQPRITQHTIAQRFGVADWQVREIVRHARKRGELP